MPSRRLDIRVETLPLAAPFRISRGSKLEAIQVRAAIHDGAATGEGACVPYARYGETVDGVMETLKAVRKEIETGLGLRGLQEKLPPGSARNALDCALWDLRAKTEGRSVAEVVGIPASDEFSTMRTVVLDRPENMARAAASFPNGVLLKVKLDREGALEKLSAVRKAAPSSPLVVDPNEGWDAASLQAAFPELKALGVVLLEQPLPESGDGILKGLPRPVPVCADEACRTAADLPRLEGRYDAVNIKLDKAGGLTAALELYRAARAKGFQVMLGCLVGDALAVAPLAALAAGADYIDLDGPLLLANGAGNGMEEIPGTARVRFNHTWGKP